MYIDIIDTDIDIYAAGKLLTHRYSECLKTETPIKALTQNPEEENKNQRPLTQKHADTLTNK